MNSILKILSFAKPYKKYLILIALIIFLNTVLELLSPYFLKLIVDLIEVKISTGEGNLSNLYLLVALMLSASVLAVFLEGINQRLGDFTTARIGKFLTEKFYRKILTLPQRYFDTQLSGKIVNQLNRGIISLQDFLGASANFIIPAFVRTIFIIVVLAFFNLNIALLVLLIFPFYIFITQYSTKKWGEFQVKKNAIDDTLRGRIQEVISNIKLVKGYSTQKNEWEFLSKKLDLSVKIYDKQSLTYHVLNFFRNFGLEVGLIVILFMVFRSTYLGQMSFGEMVLILQYLNQIRRPLFAMSFILERIKQAETGSREYFEILELESTEKLPDNVIKPMFKDPSIKFENVYFTYENDGRVLKNISCEFKHGETVALVGHSGAGKTTLVSLILKLYEATSGNIYINNKSYKDLSHQEVRSHISLVFQENELFSTTVYENVAYGKPNATKEEVVNALKKANAYEFVSKFEKGVDAEIGERGVRLSGGQKQRLQIARAILADAPILILDEATSSLDAKSEKLVQEALENLMQNRLVIIIAHRFSTIQNADKIIVVDNGTIVDSGTPQNLSHKDGIYSELLKYQIEGNQKLLEKYEIT